MCQLIFSQGERIPDIHLEVSAINNPDGFGVAFLLEHDVVTFRSMSFAAVHEMYDSLVSDVGPVPHLFHARLATHGTLDASNAHPFTVPGTDKVVLAHNGVINGLGDTGNRSDTRVFAEDWMSELGPEVLDDDKYFASLEKFIGWSKIVVLSSDERTECEWYILNAQDGKWDGDIWYANESHLYVPKPTHVQAKVRELRFDGSGDVIPDPSDEEGFWNGAIQCYTCGEWTWSGVGRDVWYDYCFVCGSCLLCGHFIESCVCGGDDHLTDGEREWLNEVSFTYQMGRALEKFKDAR